MIAEIAPAKINLYLHVGPVRADGLHALDSVFVFADAGDIITAAPAARLSLDIIGRFASALATLPIENNLVFRAALALQKAMGVSLGARLVLDKRLPIASGLGGGSADAAATLRALMRLWRLDFSKPALRRLAFRLGADVPACLDRRPVRVRGAGESLSEGPRLPPLWACLVNPNIPLPTGPVFRAFDAAQPSPPRPAGPEMAGPSYFEMIHLMKNSRNDLQAIAIARHGVIQRAIERLERRPGALAARMAGSGATVFGLFTSAAAAERAARHAAGFGWWSMSARLSAPPTMDGAMR